MKTNKLRLREEQAMRKAELSSVVKVVTQLAADLMHKEEITQSRFDTIGGVLNTFRQSLDALRAEMKTLIAADNLLADTIIDRRKRSKRKDK